MIATRYEVWFTHLLYFAPELLAGGAISAMRFEQGLQYAIRSKVSLMRLATIVDVADMATIVNKDLEESKMPSKSRSRVDGDHQRSIRRAIFSHHSLIIEDSPKNNLSSTRGHSHINNLLFVQLCGGRRFILYLWMDVPY